MTMKTTTMLRVLRDRFLRKGARQVYWDAAALGGELARQFDAGNAPFRRHAQQDLARYLLGTVRPVVGETEMRARAAAGWILRAQGASPDDGVSLGYFPCSRDGAGWRPSYPETTGYIITSLLAFADRYGDAPARAAALRMAHWEVAVQMPSGAVQGGPVCAAEQQTAAAFNTGMVLDGLCSAYAATRDETLLAGARGAADFLVADLDENGYYRTNGAFVSAGEIKTYTCLCAWAVYRFGELVDEQRYRDAAVRSVAAAVRQQQGNGWFAHNCLVRSDAPLTHTIGYTLQGVLEVGILAHRPDFISAVERTLQALDEQAQPDGYLPGMFYADWQPAVFSSCLTGSAQIAIVAYRAFALNRKAEYLALADRLTNYLKPLQALHAEDPNVVGAIAGSFPLFGEYMRGGYPNWATKYFLDALLEQDAAHAPRASRQT
jgi:uncharacterized protein YyaL (SSP411 family)